MHYFLLANKFFFQTTPDKYLKNELKAFLVHLDDALCLGIRFKNSKS